MNQLQHQCNYVLLENRIYLLYKELIFICMYEKCQSFSFFNIRINLTSGLVSWSAGTLVVMGSVEICLYPLFLYIAESAIHVLLSWVYPEFILSLSWFYPDVIQMLSRFFGNSLYPDFIQIFLKLTLSKFYPDFIQILSG